MMLLLLPLQSLLYIKRVDRVKVPSRLTAGRESYWNCQRGTSWTCFGMQMR